MKPRLKKILLILAGLFLLGFVGYFLGRGWVLKRVYSKVQSQFTERFAVKLACDNLRFTGFASLESDMLSLVPEGKDTLFSCLSFRLKIRVLPLFIGQIRTSLLEMEAPRFHLNHYPGQENYLGFRKKARKTAAAEGSEASGGRLEDLFSILPDNLSFREASMQVSDSLFGFRLRAPLLRMDDGKLDSRLEIAQDSLRFQWQLGGNFSPSERKGTFTLGHPLPGQKAVFPLLQKSTGLYADFSRLLFSLEGIAREEGFLRTSIRLGTEQFSCGHPLLSDTLVSVPKAEALLNIDAGNGYLAIDSTSVIRIDKAEFQPFVFLRYRDSIRYAFNITTPWQAANDFFSFMPRGMFASLHGLRAEGKLRYRLRFAMDAANPEALQFDSRMETNGFRITHFGEADPRMLNGPFTYTFYERGKAVRSIRVGAENPSFTPVHALPNALKQAVLAAEDPNFYGHRGFEPEAIRNAIAANYLAGRFRRGGSTLSMQLVKNVFLSRRKTLARKIEEVILVWMMEQQQLVPKERLFEVYLNVIEWGPGVLGIGEAAHWYFGKPASQVTEEEAVWLASIIPSPKRFASWFDADGNLVRSDLHLRVVWQVMQNRGIAIPADTIQSVPRVRISGAARGYLRAQPTFADSTVNTETETWEE